MPSPIPTDPTVDPTVDDRSPKRAGDDGRDRPMEATVRRAPRATVLLLVCCTAAATVACTATVPDRPERARVDLPASFAADADERARDRTLGSEPWWASFGDDQLDGLVREALTHNRDLRAAAARVEAELATARAAAGARLPRIDGSFDGARSRQNIIGIVPGRPLLTNYATSFGLGLNVSWELDVWGRVAATAGAARRRGAAAQWDLEGALQSLAAGTAKAWFAALEAHQQLEIARAAERNRDVALEAVRTSFDAGRGAALDLELARTELASASAEVARAEQNLAFARRALERLLGRYPTGAIASRGSLAAVPPPIPAGVPARLLDRRPDLRAARARLDAAGLDTEAARADLYPRLSLTASGGTRSNDLADLLDGDFRVWSIAGNLLQPIFAGGSLRARVRANAARVREASEAFAAAVLDACSEVENLLEAERLLAERERALVRAETSADRAERSALERYRGGQTDIATLLLAQRSALSARSARAAVRRARLDVRVDLHLALGGTLAGVREAPAGADDESATAIGSADGDESNASTSTEGDATRQR